MKIAQRFNAGMYASPRQVPKGRLKHGNDRFPFSRPFGTRIQWITIPALKRRAITGRSLRAAVLFGPDVVARSLQTPEGYARRSRLVWAKNPSPQTWSYL